MFAHPEGTRVVVRYTLHDDTHGATDALGYVSVRDDTHVVIATAKGLVTISLVDIIAAKEIPPPPVRA
ncbi:MAG: hypothetical protein ACOH1T_04635 [Microbacteriaceae bacterium]